jgi:hypothetical protein
MKFSCFIKQTYLTLAGIGLFLVRTEINRVEEEVADEDCANAD